MANIALVDDHPLLRDGLASLLKNLNHNVVLETGNGKEFIEALPLCTQPELVLMDVQMPEMDGYQTTLWLKKNHPGIKVMALSMNNNETSIIRMIKCGARGYLLKDSHPSEIKLAIDSIFSNGYYYSEHIHSKMVDAISSAGSSESGISLVVQMNAKELEFLKLICTELNYKEIAEQMKVSHRTLENYRDSLFEKTNVKTRIGLAMFSVKNGVVQF